VERTVIIFY